MNSCNNGGYLVGSNYWLPDQPFDYFRASFGIGSIGCNNIVCYRCKQRVRPTMEATGRRYECDCETYVTQGAFHLDTSSDSDPDPVPLWRCAGHPRFVSPGVLAGSIVDDSLGWSPIVDAHIEATTNLHPSIDHIPGFTLTRIFQALEREEDQHALSIAVGHRGNDPSLLVRQAVALFFLFNDKALGLELVLNAWRTYPSRYDHHPSAFGPDSMLKDNLIEASAVRIIRGAAETAVALATCRWAALRGLGLGVNLHLAKAFDPTWTREHVEAMFDLAPQDWYRIIRAIHVEFPMRLVPGCHRAISEGYATREQVAAALVENYGAEAAPAVAAL